MSSGKVALVTGASRGIGARVAALLGQRGVHVLVAARQLDECQVVADGIAAAGGAATAICLDVTDPLSIERAVSVGRAAAGHIGWLVNNAGVAVSAPLAASDDELFGLHMRVNFDGARRVMQALLPEMVAAGSGSIVQVASSAAIEGYPYVAAYCASKHALLGYSRAAALELLRKGVAVNVICPHYVDSPMTTESIARIVEKTGKSEPQAREFLAGQNPGGVLVTPEEVAEAVHAHLQGRRTGVVTELIGGAARTHSPGLELPDQP
ncbi:MAG: NAD(P)-dependent dehydrogenase (short-subunit alcohol dehydrogenase family) [Chlamydiales bacterium]|jgi:NAD(P)-dependent dehydrogenase (short-subunit alcohol dehydrogenase family)